MSNRPSDRSLRALGRTIAIFVLCSALACALFNPLLIDGDPSDSISEASGRPSVHLGWNSAQSLDFSAGDRSTDAKIYFQKQIQAQKDSRASKAEPHPGAFGRANDSVPGEESNHHKVQLSPERKRKLESYAEATVRYFTSPSANNLDVGFPHAFFGTGKFLVNKSTGKFRGKAEWREESWNLTRGYGSHVNMNEVTLRFVSLAAAYKMGWLSYLPEKERYNQSWSQILRGLNTLVAMQRSGDKDQFYRGHFHRAYLTTIDRGWTNDADMNVSEISRPKGEDIQSSDDSALAFMNLLILEGMASDSSLDIPDRQEIICLCREVRGSIDFQEFVVNGTIMHYIKDDQPSNDRWDRLSAEGPIILAAMLISGQITEDEFYSVAKSFEDRPVDWRSFDRGLIEINKPSYHSAMFIHGLRAVHGLPVTGEEFFGVDFYDRSTGPVLEAQIDYSEHYGLKALGSQVMTQSLYGTPVFSMDGTQVQFPGNENNFMPVPGQSLSRCTGPHAWFVPLARWRHLSEDDLDKLFEWPVEYESRFFHSGSDLDLGWETAVPWTPGDKTYAWKANDGTWKYTDWGRPYEALNTAYIVLSAFDALNPDEPLASYNVEAERLKYVARYFDSGTLLPQEIFIRNASVMHSAACTLQIANAACPGG